MPRDVRAVDSRQKIKSFRECLLVAGRGSWVVGSKSCVVGSKLWVVGRGSLVVGY